MADPEFIGPGTKSECNNKVKSKCRISLGMPKDDRLPEILAYPTKRPDYAKMVPAVQLPKLEPGDYQLIVEPRSVRAAQEPLKLAFKVTAEGSVSLSSVACSSTGIAYPGIDSLVRIVVGIMSPASRGGAM